MAQRRSSQAGPIANSPPRSTLSFTRSATTSSAASTNSNAQDAWQPVTTRPPQAISASFISWPQGFGSGVCQHDLDTHKFNNYGFWGAYPRFPANGPRSAGTFLGLLPTCINRIVALSQRSELDLYTALIFKDLNCLFIERPRTPNAVQTVLTLEIGKPAISLR